MSADKSRLASMVLVLLVSLASGLSGASAQERAGHVIAVILDDSNSMSVAERNSPGASDPDGSAAFAVTQLVRILPAGTQMMLFTYASIDNEQNRNDNGGVLYESRPLDDANREQVSEEVAASILTLNRGFLAAPSGSETLHPYSINQTPCSRAITAVASHLKTTFRTTPPKGIEIIYLSDGLCYDPRLTDKFEVPDAAKLSVELPRDASGRSARLYFIRFGRGAAAEQIGICTADGTERPGTLTKVTQGATKCATAENPLAAFEVFGQIVDHIENRQATRVVPPLPNLDYGQALGVNLLYTERCTAQNACNSCEEFRKIAEQRAMLGRFQTGRWGWPDAVAGTAPTFLARQASGGGRDRFCWVYARLEAGDVEAFRALLDKIEEPANRVNRKAVIRADFKFQLDLVPYEGNCGVGRGNAIEGGKAGTEQACVEGRIRTCTDRCEDATWSSLNLAYAKNATKSGMPPGLASEIGVDGAVRTNNIDATASKYGPVWKLGVDLPPCQDENKVEHRKEVSFVARFAGRDIGDPLQQTLCRKCTDEDGDGICASDDCNDSDANVKERLGDKKGKDCAVPGQPEGTFCARSKWICDGKKYDCPLPYDPKKQETCNGLDDNCDGHVDEGLQKCTCWEWGLVEKGEHAADCAPDAQGTHLLDFGELGSEGGIRSCWTAPAKVCLRQWDALGGISATRSSIKPAIVFQDQAGSLHDNECFRLPVLVDPDLRVVQQDQPLQLRFTATPKPMCRSISAELVEHKLDATAFLIGTDEKPENHTGVLAKIPLHLKATYKTGLKLELVSIKPEGELVVRSGTTGTDPKAGVKLKISGSLPEVAKLTIGKQVRVSRQGKPELELWRRLLDFTSEDYALADDEGRERLVRTEDDELPELFWTNCGEGDARVDYKPGTELRLDRISEEGGQEVCLGVRDLDWCKGNFLSPFKGRLCQESDRDERYDIVLVDVTLGGNDKALSGTPNAVTRSVPVRFVVERSFWGWFIKMPDGGWLWIPIGFFLWLACCWVYRVAHTFRRHHYVYFENQARCVFEEDEQGRLRPVYKRALYLGEDRITLQRRGGLGAEKQYTESAGNKADRIFKKFDAYWVNFVPNQREFYQVLGVTPRGGQVAAKFCFPVYPSSDAAMADIGRLPVPRQDAKAGEVPGLPVDHPIMSTLQQQWQTGPRRRAVRPADCGVSKGDQFVWLPILTNSRRLKEYALYRVAFQHKKKR